MRNSRSYWVIVTLLLLNLSNGFAQNAKTEDGYRLVWSDEFEKDGVPNPKNWTYEKGFVRNNEAQWYQPENAFCKNGKLIIEARREERANPNYVANSKDWRKNRSKIEYTSACLITRGLQQFQYGRFEMRAKIDIDKGLWPAFWTLGVEQPWPANGEIDIMEFYADTLLANIASAGKNGRAKWFSNTKRIEELGGAKWAKQFHVWRMDWDEESISLYVDDVLFNKTQLSKLENEDRQSAHPFKQPHYILLDLAIGGMHGGDPIQTKFPKRFEVDYVRVYQR